MWKKRTDKGGSLPELLVILAVTVVMAAILLPAVVGPSDTQVNAESTFETDTVRMDGHVRPSSITTEDRYSSRAIASADEQALDDSMDHEIVTDESASLSSSALELEGLQNILTTDINYVIP